jgi:hypothetical protein
VAAHGASVGESSPIADVHRVALGRLRGDSRRGDTRGIG